MKNPDFDSLLNSDSIKNPVASAIPSGRELQELLSPIDTNEFINSYFAKTSLNIEGSSGKFDHLFSWARLKIALARGESITDKRYNITASFTGGEEHGSAKSLIQAQHSQVSQLFNAGATICITNIHMADPLLAKWALAVRNQLNFSGTVGVNCYASPDSSGLPMHYDKRVATSLQISGKKRWKFSKQPAQAWPNQNEVYQGDDVDLGGKDIGKLPPEMEFDEVELSPGHLLCLPAGAWHSARGNGPSLALNLYFSPRNFIEQLAPLLNEFSSLDENWRGGPPAVAERVHGNVPDPISAYMNARLQDFQKFALEKLSSPEGLIEPWLGSLTNAPYTGWRPEPLLSIPNIAPDQQFHVAESSLRFIEGPDRIMLPCDIGILKFPLSLAPIFRRLASCSTTFTVPEVLSWQQSTNDISPNEIMSHLKTLYKHGFLKMI